METESVIASLQRLSRECKAKMREARMDSDYFPSESREYKNGYSQGKYEGKMEILSYMDSQIDEIITKAIIQSGERR